VPVHTTHPDIIKRLRRVEGHLRSVITMIDEGRKCLDIAQQLPSVDVREDDDRFPVHNDLPGVGAKDIHVTVDNGALTVRGECRFEKKAGKKGFERLERVEGSFLRRFTLPDNGRADESRARYNNGVLEVVIPTQAAPETRRVNVKVN
jgi:HSP20 family protein